MKKKTTGIALFMLLTTLVLVLAACGGAKPEPTKAPTAAPAKAAAPTQAA